MASSGTSLGDVAGGEEAGKDGGLPPLDAAPDKPPKERRPRRGRPKGQSAAQQIIDGFTGLYVLVGGVVMAFDRYDGEVILSKSHDMAVALEQVARHNSEVYNILLKLSNVNDLSMIIMSYGAVSYAIAANHRLVPTYPVAMFHLPLPPKRAPEEAVPPPFEQPGPMDTGTEAYYGPPMESEPMGTETVPEVSAVATGLGEPMSDQPQAGLHINPDMMRLIQMEAMAAAERQRKLAMQQGTDGLVNPRGAS